MPFTVIIISCLTSLILILLLFPRSQSLWVPSLLHQCLAQCLTGLGGSIIIYQGNEVYVLTISMSLYFFNSSQFDHPMSNPMPEVRGGGREEQPHAPGQRWWLRGATPCRRSSGWAGVAREATPRSRPGGAAGEEIPLVQGNEHQLCFAGAAVKRYPMSKVRETQVRWQVFREGIRGQTHWNHNHRKLVNLITLGPQPCLTQRN